MEVRLADGIGERPAGQAATTILINQLARMKGVVNSINVLGAEDCEVLPRIPLEHSHLLDGLEALVTSLNSDQSEFVSRIEFGSSATPDVKVALGHNSQGADVVVGADGWRAFLGSFVELSDWDTESPYGSAMAASLAGAEIFKRLLEANGIEDKHRRSAGSVAFSLFNYGLGREAEPGPTISDLPLTDMAVVGCGAGGTAALYVLSLQVGIRGHLALIEPGRHKESNLNRYLMTRASDVHEHRHKLSSVTNHLARYAPGIVPELHASTWEMLNAYPWALLLSTVDTVPARWSIQHRSRSNALILDGAVLDLLYSVLRVVPEGWCLECKHPYDVDYELKERAARWGTSLEEVKHWTSENLVVTPDMIAMLSVRQNRKAEEFAHLLGQSFRDATPLIECGATALRTDVPSQAPVLPLATTPVGAVLAAEVVKEFVAPEAGLGNWLAHDLAAAPSRPRTKWRPAITTCPLHDPS